MDVDVLSADSLVNPIYDGYPIQHDWLVAQGIPRVISLDRHEMQRLVIGDDCSVAIERDVGCGCGCNHTTEVYLDHVETRSHFKDLLRLLVPDFPAKWKLPRHHGSDVE